MKYSFFLFVFVILFACGASEINNGNPPDEPLSQDSINKILLKIHAKEKAYQIDTLFKNKVKDSGFNGCVLVAQNGVVIYKKAFGFANFKNKDSLKTKSAFQLASASKTFTATAVLLLKDRGLLNLTDPVTKYFPQFPYTGVTIKALLSHRSGLGNYVYFCEPYCKDCSYNGKAFDNDAVLGVIETYKPEVYAKPDKKFEYCNTNYALLASIVEKVSGQPFAEFLTQNIFQPLGMNDTWVHDAKTDKERKSKTTGYNGLGKLEEDKYADDVLGDKGVYSTVEDMFKWDQSFYTEKILKKETIEAAYTGYSNEHPGKRNYGYGWRIVDDGKNPKIVFHNGWWHGYNSVFMRRPSDQAVVIVLSNKYNRSAYRVQGVFSILNEGAAGAELDGEE